MIQIRNGMNIPADGVIIKSAGVTVNESAMTGESREMKKESIDVCFMRREEKDMEYQYSTAKERKSYDLPSPIMLSGT